MAGAIKSMGIPLILPPQASTNWLFNEHVLFNVFTARHLIIMDEADFHRYERLAAISSMDFLKFYLLSVLRRIGIVQLRDYAKIYNQKLVEKSLESISESRILQSAPQYEATVRQGYLRYLNYISGKEKALAFLSQCEKTKYLDEKSIAESQLEAIGSRNFGDNDMCNYIRRLATKLMAAESVTRAEGGKIFDSLEYQDGFTILQEKQLVSTNTAFAADVFTHSDGYDRLTEFCMKYFRDFGPLWEKDSKPLSIWTPLALFENVCGYSDELLGLLRSEIEQCTPTILEEEVRECREVRKGAFRHLRKYDKQGELLWTSLGLILWPLSFLSILRAVCGLWKSEVSLSSKFSLVSQLIVVALEEEDRHYNLEWRAKLRNWWIRWFHKVLRHPSALDRTWDVTQRRMGEWTRADLYVPPFEGSRDLLEKYHLA